MVRIRGITPDFEWVRAFSYRFPLHQYMRRNLGWHARMFERDSEQSSYRLLDPILTQENIDIFYLGDQLHECSSSTTSLYLDDQFTSSATPLSFAASYGLTFFCRDKIVAGVDVNESHGAALLMAAVNAYERTVRMLLEHGAYLTRKHLIKILENLSLQTIKEIWHGQGVSWQSGDQGLHEKLTPLHCLMENDTVNFNDLIVFFLKNGEDINAHARPHGTPLHALLCKRARSSITKKMKVLIQNGADVNADGPEGKPLDLLLEKLREDAKTGLKFTLGEYIPEIELLIDNGAVSDHAGLEAISRIRDLVHKFDRIRYGANIRMPETELIKYINEILGEWRAELGEIGL
jgi:hypothetical protein